MSSGIPVLLQRLVDDAAVFPPGNAPLPEAVAAHARHRAAWYADLVGPLLVPASAAADLVALVAKPGQEPPAVGLIGDCGWPALASAVATISAAGIAVRQVEVPVAKRGEDPQPGLVELERLLDRHSGLVGFAETPLSWGLVAALDTVAQMRQRGICVWPKFRTGGLAAELFPTPMELAAVIAACRDRALAFKLTAGLHHAIRHPDPQTGLVHHGFLNVLVAAGAAAADAEVERLAEVLASTDPVPLVDQASRGLDQARSLWLGFGSCSISEPLTELVTLGLLHGWPG